MEGESPDPDELLTAEESAAIYKWKKNTYYCYASTGKIPAVKIGRSLRFRRGDLEKLVVVRGVK